MSRDFGIFMPKHLAASTWDEELVEKVGKAGAEEVKENNISKFI